MILVNHEMPKSCAVCFMNRSCLLWEQKANFKEGTTYKNGRAMNCPIMKKITEKEQKLLLDNDSTAIGMIKKKKKALENLEKLNKEITVLQPLLKTCTENFEELEQDDLEEER